MGAITLRNLPPQVERHIHQLAAREGLSLNKAVVRLLEEAVGGGARDEADVEHDDLDHLAGSWSEKEAEQFGAALAEQRRVDDEVWR